VLFGWQLQPFDQAGEVANYRRRWRAIVWPIFAAAALRSVFASSLGGPAI